MCGGRPQAQSDRTGAEKEMTAMEHGLRSSAPLTTRAGVLIGLAAGAVGVAAMISTVGAPAARADDFSDIISSVELDFANGLADVDVAYGDFAGADPSDGLAMLVNGVDDALVSPGENLFIGSLDALTNQPIQTSLVFQEGSVADLTAASADVQSLISLAESEFSVVIPDLASGDIAGATADSIGATDLLVVLSPEVVFEGLAGSLGL
jgi:hypothetical protein